MINLRCWWKGHYMLLDHYEKPISSWEHSTPVMKCKYCGIMSYKDYTLEKSFWERHELLHGLAIIGVGIVGFSLFILIIFGIPTAIGYYLDCRNQGTIMEVPWRYDIISGCYYQIKGQWISRGLLNIVHLLQ